MVTAARGTVATVFMVVVVALTSMSLAPAQDKKDKAPPAKTAALTFEVYKDKGGDFRFRMKDSDGTILGGASKGYGKKEEVMKIPETLKKGAASAKIDDQSGK